MLGSDPDALRGFGDKRGGEAALSAAARVGDEAREDKGERARCGVRLTRMKPLASGSRGSASGAGGGMSTGAGWLACVAA